jgi:hypothetical protein
MHKWLASSLAVNALLAGILISRIPLIGGGGQYKEKNGMVANASSLSDSNPLNSNEVFYEFSVATGVNGRNIARIEYRNPKTSDSMAMRSYPEVVNWSDDGSSVRFITPEIEVTLKNLK